MKNREKYRSEIVEVLKEHNADNEKMCCFLRDNVIPQFTSEEDMERAICGNLECHTCTQMFSFWLDEEYVEPQKPEVDWSKVPVDTLVMVRDSEHDEWVLRYFKGIDENHQRRYAAWSGGATSVTAHGSITHWKYCELVEDEHGSN